MPKEYLLNLQLNHQGSFKGSSPKGASSHNKIVAACVKLWQLSETNPPHNRHDHSDFVRSVAKGFGVSLSGDANGIFSQIQRSPWNHLGCGEYGANLAAAHAASGKLVVGAWKNPVPGKAGHVAIVFDARQPSTTVPYRCHGIAYWGTLGLEGSQGSQGSPSSQGSGGANPGRTHQPIKVTRENDAASPLLINHVLGSVQGVKSSGSGGSGSGGSNGGTKHQPIVITRENDAASPLLWNSCSNPSATVAAIHYASFEIDPGAPRVFF